MDGMNNARYNSLKRKSKMAARAKMFAAYKSSNHNSTKMNFLLFTFFVEAGCMHVGLADLKLFLEFGFM